ncbi:MAG TPA: hypothetical protein VGP72_32060 [Planctomycetota bacterium]|jgi:hypothetical protein
MGKINTIIDRATTIASGVIASARIKKGYYPLLDTDEFFQDLVTNGPFLIIDPMTPGDFTTGTGQSEYTLKMKMYFGFNKDAAFDYSDVQNAFEALRNLLGGRGYGGWTDCAAPKSIRCGSAPEVSRKDVMIGMYEFELSFLQP